MNQSNIDRLIAWARAQRAPFTYIMAKRSGVVRDDQVKSTINTLVHQGMLSVLPQPRPYAAKYMVNS